MFKKFYVDFKIILLSLSFLSFPSYSNNLQLGAGVGLPYGGMGMNAQYLINKQTRLLAGIGTYGGLRGLGTVLGASYYPDQLGLKFSGYFGSSIGYDYFTCNQTQICKVNHTIANGLSAGIGYDLSKDRQSGFEIEILFRIIIDENYKIRRENDYQLSRMTLSLGYYWSPFNIEDLDTSNLFNDLFDEETSANNNTAMQEGEFLLIILLLLSI